MIWYTLCVVTIGFLYYAETTLDITFKKYEMCEDPKDTPMQYWTTFKKINSTVSTANGKAVLPYDLGDDVMLDSVIDIFRDDEWKPLYTLKERPLCSFVEKYGGPLLHEAQEHFEVRQAHGLCPIPKGTYNLKDYVVDFSKLTIKTAPKATIRATSHLKREGELLMCFYSEFELQ